MSHIVQLGAATPPGWQAQLPGSRPERVAGWHQRAREFGLGEGQRPQFDGLGGAAMRRVLDEHQLLYSHALPVMETLQQQIQNTHTMVILTDENGLILHSLGDQDFLAQAEGVALRRGVCWSEQRMGTNAIGTALTDKTATVVHADEHFLLANRFLTCSCSPILDPQGRIIGALDVSGPRESYHAHTMALVRMSTQMIENKLFAHVYENYVRLHFHSRPEFVGTLVEGIAAFGPDGRVVALNRSAQFQLNLSDADLRRHSLGSLFGCSVARLMERLRSAPSGMLTLSLHNGAKVVARGDWHVTRTPGTTRTRAGEDVPADRGAAAGGAAARGAPAPGVAARGGLPPSLAQLNGGDPAVAKMVGKISRVLNHEIPLIILGETGTGKELWARAIHDASARRDGAFVAVDCASIPESLIESELFGYEDGAFTGARKKGCIGKIAQSSGGTLFLDEIGDMPVSLQTRLLRVLQERVVTPLGSARSVPVDLRVIAATHRNLRGLISAGQFREDLYYRLNGLSLRLPALRERSDLERLIDEILGACAPGAVPRLEAGLMAAFKRYPWPGNIRQLTSVLRTACLMASDGEAIGPQHLQEEFLDELRAGGACCPSPESPSAAGTQALDAVRRSAIEAALQRCAGNVSAAARSLGVSRNTIYRCLRAGAAASVL
jgi:transcriptional regulator of acetoin/glycerol metabolism